MDRVEDLRLSSDHALSLGRDVQTPKGPGVVIGYARELLTYAVNPKTPTPGWKTYFDRDELEALNP